MARSAVTTLEQLEQALPLLNEERSACQELATAGGLPLGVTAHYLSLIDKSDPNDPLRLQVVPRAAELTKTAWERRDPLGEEELEAVPFLVHRYPDRVLLLATDRCAAYCRFCTRKRWVGQGPTPTQEQLRDALAYIAAHRDIREVIVSGGDALILSDARLRALLDELCGMGHLDVVRLATRVLTFDPARVTPQLVEAIATRPGGPATYVLSHFNHPRELAPLAQHAITLLVDAGIPVLNQTVLLRGVNDQRETLVELFRLLTRLRARPYYLHQCDLAPGTEAFRVPLDEARALHHSLRGHISGLSIPTFVVEVPGGLGKVPMNVVPVADQDDDAVQIVGFDGRSARYPRR
jgi:lysine 2,3-aminomutase